MDDDVEDLPDYEELDEELDDGDDDEVLEKAPDGGLRAWLIVLSCFGINLIVSTMTALVDFSVNDKNITQELSIENTTVRQASNYFKSLSDLFAPIALLVMMKFGYKVTVIVGSLILCFAFTNMSMLGGGSEKSIGGYWQFWLCGPAAFGMNFLKLGALIPVLEYFKDKRMKALVLSRLGLSLGSFATMFILFADNVKWRTLFRINAGLCVLSLGIALTLRNMEIKHKDKKKNKKKEKIFKRIIGIFDIPVLKNRTFWIIMAVFFFFKFGLTPAGLTLPLVPIKMMTGGGSPSTTDSLQGAIGGNIGGLGGQGSAFLFKRLKFMKRFSKKSLMFVLTMVAISGPVIGIFSVITPDTLIFYTFFNLVFMIFQVLSENMRDESIPTVYGRENIRITESFLNMFVGFAGMIAGSIQHAVDDADSKDGWKANLKFGGSFLIITGVGTAVMIILHKLGKFKLKEKAGAARPNRPNSSSKQSGGDEKQNDESLPEDIDEISKTEMSPDEMHNMNNNNHAEIRQEPPIHANSSKADDRLSTEDRMQQAYGMPPKTRHLSISNLFPSETVNQTPNDGRMNRSQSTSGFNNHQGNERHSVNSGSQNVQGMYPFQGPVIQGRNSFQGGSGQFMPGQTVFLVNNPGMPGQYPSQGNMQGQYQFVGYNQNMQPQPGKDKGKSKKGKDKGKDKGKEKKQRSSQNYPFDGNRQPMPNFDPNRSNGNTDNYVDQQITNDGTVLY